MPVKLKNRHRLSKKEKKSMKSLLSDSVQGKLRIEDCGSIDVGEFEYLKIYLCDGSCFLVSVNYNGRDILIPCLRHLLKVFSDRGMTVADIGVDRGAVKALMRGANLMAPGVREVLTDFPKDSIVVISDAETRAPVAVGVSLVSSDELRSIVANKMKGKVVDVLHYVGDKIWKYFS
jgi:predicted RNA-binding protein (TIGR00451 family)